MLTSLKLSSTECVNEYSRWMRSREWDHKVDLTFAWHVSATTAERHFQVFVRRLQQRAQGPIDFFGGIERGDVNNRVHLHAVLHGTSQMEPEAISEAWGSGITIVETYDPNRDGVGYAGKRLAEMDSHLLLPDRPVRRQKTA